MNIVAINGSTRVKGNTHMACEIVAEDLRKNNHKVQTIDLATKKLHPCLACGKCEGTKRCVQTDDINDLFLLLDRADGIILASPVYFSNVSSRMAMFIERTGMMFSSNENCFKGKIGASIAVVRRAGANVVYSLLNYYFGIGEMPIVSSCYWNNIIARDIGDIMKDHEGLTILHTLATHMNEMLQSLRPSKSP